MPGFHSFYKWLDNPVYCPNFSIVFRMILVARLTAAIWSPIADCDEVYNYYEPTHYLEFGRGLQTWEYSPVYAIRSWAYLLPHSFVGHVGTFAMFASSKVQGFYILRLTLAVVSAFAEASLVRSLNDGVSPKLAVTTLASLLLSTGMWTAGVSFLPSSFAMYAVTAAVAQGLRSTNLQSVLATVWLFALGTVWGWPFSGLLALPYVIYILCFARDTPRLISRIAWLTGCLLTVLATLVAPLLLIDSFFYKKWVFVPWNIVKYNVLSKGHGPELYGVEPWYFYAFNGALNWNVQLVLALVGFALTVGALWQTANQKVKLNSARTPKKPRADEFTSAKAIPKVVCLTGIPLILWLVVLSLQPHKEERFLYPVYPLVAINSSVALLYLLKLNWRRVVILLFLCSATISILRTVGLSKHYGAPLKLYTRVYDHLQSNSLSSAAPVNTSVVCLGDEWYRFPSSYFIPKDSRVGFVRGGFDGLLPLYFREAENSSETFFKSRPGTSAVPQTMNNVNRMEEAHLTSCNSCTHFVGIPSSDGSLPQCKNRLTEKLFCYPFLDGSKSGLLVRLFFVPDRIVLFLKAVVSVVRQILRNKLSFAVDYLEKSLHATWVDYCFYKYTE